MTNETDAKQAGRKSPGRAAWDRTAHIRDAAIARVGRPHYERTIASFIAHPADPSVVITWLHQHRGGC